MKKVFIILSIIILILVISKEDEKNLIPNEAIRIRVIANSNNIEDQLIKLKVKEKVTDTLYTNLDKVKNISEARHIINDSIKTIENDISKTINNRDFSINYGSNYFPEKKLNGIKYKEGNYESLVINIGEAKGNNWWCVLFPPLCMIEATETENDNVEYKSKILEILNEYK